MAATKSTKEPIEKWKPIDGDVEEQYVLQCPVDGTQRLLVFAEPVERKRHRRTGRKRRVVVRCPRHGEIEVFFLRRKSKKAA